MDTYIKPLFLLISILFASCTDVIDVEVQASKPRLVIEASIDWKKGTIGNRQTIKLSISTPYFDTNTHIPAIGASVKVTNDSDGTNFIFIDQDNGEYTITNFLPDPGQSFTLEIIYDGETYIAKETLIPVASIEDTIQSKHKGFDKDAIEVSVSYIDPEDEDNYYLIKFQEQNDLFPTLADVDDEFTNGNRMVSTYEKIEDEETGQAEFKPGDILHISLYGISKDYYHYIGLLRNQSESSGDPFSTTPAPLKGNCINISNPDNYAYGYFRLTQVSKTSHTIQ